MQNIPYSNQNQNYNQNNYQNQNPTQYIITKDIIYKASKRFLGFPIKVGLITCPIGLFFSLILLIGESNAGTDDNVSTGYLYLSFIFTLLFTVALIFFIHIYRKATTKTKAALRNNQFIIYPDIVGDKERIKITYRGRPLEDTILKSTNLSTVDFLYLYNTYTYFGVPFDVSKVHFNDTSMCDEYYVAYIIPTRRFAILPKKHYVLDNSLMFAYRDPSTLSNYNSGFINRNPNNWFPAGDSITNIDENGLFELFKKYDKSRTGQKVVIGINIIFFLFGLLLITVEPAVTLFFTILVCASLAAYLVPIKNNDSRVQQNILSNNYYITPCVVQENVTYRNAKLSDRFVFFRVNEIPFDVKCLKLDFDQTQVGDTIYVCSMYRNNKQISQNVLEPFAVLNPMKHRIAPSILSKLQ